MSTPTTIPTPPSPNMAPAMCPRDLALLLGISRSGVTRVIRTKGFPTAIWVGRSRRWLRDEVLAWMHDQAERAPLAGE